jgi:hypothetical protein
MGNDGGPDIPFTRQLEVALCPDCEGLGHYTQDCCGEPYACREYWDCRRCMGAGEVEIQHGPQDQDHEVSDRTDPGKPRPAHPPWLPKRQG